MERRLVREVERRGGMALKWVSPGQRGVPDRIVLLPGGRTVYVEMKATGGRLSVLQVRWARLLRELGHEVYKIDSVEGVEDFIREVMTT